MKELKRQDKNGVRTAVDLERRYTFGNINLTLEEVEELKKLIVVDSSLSTTSTNPVQNKVITSALNNKVNKETGKSLIETTLIDKLEDIESNAQKNVIESISVNGVQQAITDKNVNLQITNFTVLTGTIDKTTGYASISYPSGFTKDNCIVNGFMTRPSGNDSWSSILPDGAEIVLQNDIYISGGNFYSEEVAYKTDIDYKLVLMKIS